MSLPAVGCGRLFQPGTHVWSDAGCRIPVVSTMRRREVQPAIISDTMWLILFIAEALATLGDATAQG
jgi:hypothetical protein